MTIDRDKVEESKTNVQTQSQFGIKPTRAAPGAGEKKGRFAVEEFDQVGTIKGTPATDFDLESAEEKPWKKPGKKDERTAAEARSRFITMFIVIQIVRFELDMTYRRLFQFFSFLRGLGHAHNSG